jgi:hypothetical protein
MLTAPLPLQTAYPQYEPVAQLGMPATMVGWDADTRIIEDPTGNGIKFGLAVCQGYMSDKGVTLGQLSGGAFIGITQMNIYLPLSQARAVDTYFDTDNALVMVRGDLWVAPATTVQSGSQVYYNAVTGQLGSASVPNAVLIQNARWETSLPNFGQSPLVNFNGLATVRLGASAQ